MFRLLLQRKYVIPRVHNTTTTTTDTTQSKSYTSSATKLRKSKNKSKSRRKRTSNNISAPVIQPTTLTSHTASTISTPQEGVAKREEKCAVAPHKPSTSSTTQGTQPLKQSSNTPSTIPLSSAGRTQRSFSSISTKSKESAISFEPLLVAEEAFTEKEPKASPKYVIQDFANVVPEVKLRLKEESKPSAYRTFKTNRSLLHESYSSAVRHDVQDAPVTDLSSEFEQAWTMEQRELVTLTNTSPGKRRKKKKRGGGNNPCDSRSPGVAPLSLPSPPVPPLTKQRLSAWGPGLLTPRDAYERGYDRSRRLSSVSTGIHSYPEEEKGGQVGELIRKKMENIARLKRQNHVSFLRSKSFYEESSYREEFLRPTQSFQYGSESRKESLREFGVGVGGVNSDSAVNIDLSFLDT